MVGPANSEGEDIAQCLTKGLSELNVVERFPCHGATVSKSRLLELLLIFTYWPLLTDFLAAFSMVRISFCGETM